MDPSTLTQITTLLEKIKVVDIAEKLSVAFPKEDLSVRQFAPFSGVELVTLTAQAVGQMQNELQSSSAKLLPPGFYWETTYETMAHRHISDVLQSLFSYLSNGNWSMAPRYLELFIGYQISCGFWNRSARKLGSITREKQHILLADLETKTKQYRELLGEMAKKNEDFSNEFEVREVDAQTMENFVKEANSHFQSLGKILTQASNNEGHLAEIRKNQEKNLEEANAKLQSVGKQYEDLQELLKNAAGKLEEAQKKLQFIEGKADVVNEIAGTAGAGLLGRKFEARKRVLQKSAQWWMWATVASLFVAAGWLAIAHQFLVIKDSDVWKTLAANFGLLLPAIFIVGFFAKQFSKVRQFEEEYAFRSSVAMTLSAFAEKLSDSPGEKNKLIVDTVERLYRLPVSLEAVEKRPSFLQERAIQRTLKSAAELIREVKGSE